MSIIEYYFFFIVWNSDIIIFTEDYQFFILRLRVKPDFGQFLSMTNGCENEIFACELIPFMPLSRRILSSMVTYKPKHLFWNPYLKYGTFALFSGLINCHTRY